MVKTARLLVYRVCLLLLFHSVLLHAEVIPGRWEKVEAQKQGTELTLILHSGEPVYGLLKEVTHDTVIVIEEGGGQRSVTGHACASLPPLGHRRTGTPAFGESASVNLTSG